MSNYADALAADGRLCILKELARQTDGRLNESVLAQVLDAYGIRRSREWVRTQLRALEELGAIRLAEVGSVLVASLTQLGQDHVDRRVIVDGVSRPSIGG